MWNINPEQIQQVKEELKGRRDAIQAKYADELKRLEADLQEITTLERVAHEFAAKHFPEQPAEAAPEPEEEPQDVAMLQPAPVEPVAPAPENKGSSDGKGLSRWRLRSEAQSGADPA